MEHRCIQWWLRAVHEKETLQWSRQKKVQRTKKIGKDGKEQIQNLVHDRACPEGRDIRSKDSLPYATVTDEFRKIQSCRVDREGKFQATPLEDVQRRTKKGVQR